MKTTTQLTALLDASQTAVEAAFNDSQKNVDHRDILPVLQNLLENERAFLENEFSITPTFVDNTDGTGTLTLQVKDGNGDNVTSAVEVDVAFSATEGGVYADLGTLAATTGTIVFSFLADAHARVRSNATGAIVLTLTTADEWFLRAQVVGSSQGSVLTGSYTVTGP